MFWFEKRNESGCIFARIVKLTSINVDFSWLKMLLRFINKYYNNNEMLIVKW